MAMPAMNRSNSLPMTNADELSSLLEFLPSYTHLLDAPVDSPVFDEAEEPSVGLINFIRSTSHIEQPKGDLSGSAEDTSIIPSYLIDEIAFEPTEEKSSQGDLLELRLKHLFILSENGKPVFTRFVSDGQE